MEIDQAYFRSLLQETIEENPLACRAVLLICDIEFTGETETLSVSLGSRSTLRVNLEFVRKHCANAKHVKALIVHEFLHILLGHTMKFGHMTPALNVALDAIINAIIHRKLGEDYSSMMATYYAQARGVFRLLRPLNGEEKAARSYNFKQARLSGDAPDAHLTLHSDIYTGFALAEDIVSIANSMNAKALAEAVAPGHVLLGDHNREPVDLEKLGAAALRIKGAFATIDASGIFANEDACKPQILSATPAQKRIPASWRAQTLPVLRRLLLPDPNSRVSFHRTTSHLAPVLNTSDRRGSLRAIWSPFIPDIVWNSTQERPAGSVQIYLDVSGSMDVFLDAIVALLAEFGAHIRKPLWAFSTQVHPARIVRGKLQTKSTGGTSIGCVYDHIFRTRPLKALIVTDGYVEAPQFRHSVHDFCRMEAIIPHDGYDGLLLTEHRIPTTRLANLSTAA